MTNDIDLFAEASKAYYRSGQPIMTDDEFDALRQRIQEAYPDHPILATVGTPSEQKRPHTIRMGSLNKITDGTRLARFLDSLPGTEVVVEWKYDGSSVELVYTNGKLAEAITRGDGEFGEDVTIACWSIPTIPKVIPMTGTVSVRGEVILTFDEWGRVSDKKTNPRNVGNGLLVRNTAVSGKHLTFIPHDMRVTAGEGVTPANYRDMHGVLHGLGFTYAGANVLEPVTVGKADVRGLLERMEGWRKTLPVAVDGAVIKTYYLEDDTEVVSGRPKAQVAYKWQSERATSTVIGVTVTVGHTGLLSPTLQLEPIQLGGVTVSNVLANNFDEITRLGIGVGDEVSIFRAGELIPKLEGVVVAGDGPRIEVPARCPCCGGQVGRRQNTGGDESTNIFCLSEECSGKAIGKVKKWLTKLDILGIGDGLLEELFETGLVESPRDLYSLTSDVLSRVSMGAGVVGDSRAIAIINNINGKRVLPLADFLGALGIPFLGKSRAKLIMSAAGSIPDPMDTLQDWMSGKLLRIAEQCQVVNISRAICDWFDKNTQVVSGLLEIITVLDNKEAEADRSDTGEGPRSMCFLLTGKFDVPKGQIHERILKSGHRYVESWCAGIDYLVQSDPASKSSKSKKAEASSVPIIGYTGLLELLGD